MEVNFELQLDGSKDVSIMELRSETRRFSNECTYAAHGYDAT